MTINFQTWISKVNCWSVSTYKYIYIFGGLCIYVQVFVWMHLYISLEHKLEMESLGQMAALSFGGIANNSLCCYIILQSHCQCIMVVMSPHFGNVGHYLLLLLLLVGRYKMGAHCDLDVRPQMCFPDWCWALSIHVLPFFPLFPHLTETALLRATRDHTAIPKGRFSVLVLLYLSVASDPGANALPEILVNS